MNSNLIKMILIVSSLFFTGFVSNVSLAEEGIVTESERQQIIKFLNYGASEQCIKLEKEGHAKGDEDFSEEYDSGEENGLELYLTEANDLIYSLSDIWGYCHRYKEDIFCSARLVIVALDNETEMEKGWILSGTTFKCSLNGAINSVNSEVIKSGEGSRHQINKQSIINQVNLMK